MYTQELMNILNESATAINKVSQAIADGVENAEYGYITDKLIGHKKLIEHVIGQAKFKKREQGRKR